VVILGPLEFHGAIDAWAEYLCVERLADGSLELSSRSGELLGYSGDWFGEPVWPEGCGPDVDEDVLSTTVGGKTILGRDRDGVVGHKLVPLAAQTGMEHDGAVQSLLGAASELGLR
jgi:hypothetical protein